MNISIFGIGYVGTVSAVCLSNNGHKVIAVDTSPFKVQSINEGKSPIVEPDVDDLLHRALNQGMLSATTDVAEAVLNTDISLLCVGTPSKANGSLSLDHVMHVADQIGAILSKKPGYHGVVIRSTVPPGTIEAVTRILEDASGKKVLKDFGVAFNPEFLREGTSILDFKNPPYTVIGTVDDRMVQMLKEIFKGVNAPFHLMKVKEAELLKYTCNSFHAVKVTFANEIGAISKKLGIDSHAVMKIFVDDTKLNISPYYLKPGFAFGGSCLPKDVRAITYESRILDVATPLLDALLPSNALQIQRVVDWVIEKKKKKIGVLGLSFKSDTDDLRESPIVNVIETLLGKGYAIAIYDSNVYISRLVGANRSYVEQVIPHISLLMKRNVKEVLDFAEVILVANKGAGFNEVLTWIRPDQVVLDLVRVTDELSMIKGKYEGICW